MVSKETIIHKKWTILIIRTKSNADAVFVTEFPKSHWVWVSQEGLEFESCQRCPLEFGTFEQFIFDPLVLGGIVVLFGPSYDPLRARSLYDYTQKWIAMPGYPLLQLLCKWFAFDLARENNSRGRRKQKTPLIVVRERKREEVFESGSSPIYRELENPPIPIQWSRLP